MKKIYDQPQCTVAFLDDQPALVLYTEQARVVQLFGGVKEYLSSMKKKYGQPSVDGVPEEGKKVYTHWLIWWPDAEIEDKPTVEARVTVGGDVMLMIYPLSRGANYQKKVQQK